ncbi:exodeoxyribonuclease V subunit gamma [Shewanella aquimarina]|uniref:exodeoxyribonuclease V subunit gamma n=1 Tax=Shewanella aquimarina TaxID=260365 RepID=UPI002014C1C2|nr:exodeoxyribonuclease V subunit gamma [Shewanella aquimarina]MCL2909280.1 exodeoxyribonuclease V subunit gamma [Shewanella aquimarina]
MLYLVQSNRIEALAQLLANELQTPPAGQSPLSNEQILVQSPGMSTWLRLAIAEQNSVAAALEFPLPSSFIWQLCHQLLPDVPKENAFTKPAMTWKLMELLPGLLSQEVFAPLAHYLKDDAILEDSAAPHSLKLFQLCSQIADIFDQYLVYRPDWILAWEQGEDRLPPKERPLDGSQQWQSVLWRALIHYNHHTLNQSRYHRANLHQALFDALSNPQCDLSKLPTRLFVFGISSMAPQTLEVLYFLAKRIDVVMLNLSPCQHYWGDIVDPKLRARMALQYGGKQQLSIDWESKLEVGNPLLANNGKMGRELLDLILELPENDTNFNFECYQDPGSHTVLQGVQQDILELSTRGQTLGPDAELYLTTQGRRILASDDDSLTLRSCHSPLRELETLHDHLLERLSRSDGLAPKDIVVMMPDVAAYAPYIDAVFASKRGDHFIPYAIADRGAAQESPLINSFLHLLGLNKSRFALTDVLGILEVPAVMRRFELNDDDLQLIRRWLEQAGVRWGRDEQSRQAQQLPAFEHNSWAFGIKRLILGYSFSDEAPIYHDSLALPGVEGQSAQALGKLLNFIEAIDEFNRELDSHCPLGVRITQLQNLVETFYDCIEEELNQKQELLQAIMRLSEELTATDYQSELELEVMQNWFTRHLTESRVGQRYLAGSVNFCTLMPMRSIPFKVVCLLGMNDGVYPRVQHPVGFDLVAQEGPRKGDRSRRLDDRYLFLEALLSAREQLYISYIGHSERDNSERIPSMLVSELIEYCQFCYLPASCADMLNGDTDTADIAQIERAILAQLIVTMPLQPFDERLYLAQEAPPEGNHQAQQLRQSYSEQWCPTTHAEEASEADGAPHTQPGQFITEPLSLIADEDKDEPLELSALIRFFRNPAQYFFNRTLKLDLSLSIQMDENDEPFALNALSRYQLQSLLIEDAVKSGEERPSDNLLKRLRLSGQLPLAPFDDILLNQYLHDIRALVGRTLYLQGESSHTQDIDLTLSDSAATNLVGRIDGISAKGLVNYRPGTANARDLIRVYLRHLCLNAAADKGQATPWQRHSYLLDIGHFHGFAPITPEQALNQLSRWAEHYHQGQCEPLPFMPRTALAYVEAEGEHREKLIAAQPQWLDEQSNLGEGQEAHYQRLFTFPDDFSEAGFGTIATSLLSPMLSLYHKAPLSELADFVEGQ